MRGKKQELKRKWFWHLTCLWQNAWFAPVLKISISKKCSVVCTNKKKAMLLEIWIFEIKDRLRISSTHPWIFYFLVGLTDHFHHLWRQDQYQVHQVIWKIFTSIVKKKEQSWGQCKSPKIKFDRPNNRLTDRWVKVFHAITLTVLTGVTCVAWKDKHL